MKSKRSNSKIFQRLLCLLLAFFVSSQLSEPLKVEAAGEYDEWANSVVDSTGNGGGAGSSTVKNGVMSTRTGYLCYMLTTDGQTVPGTTAQAFYSPGYNGLSGSSWIAASRKGGYSATTWRGNAPWNCTPWTPSSDGKTITTNEPQIKQWMTEQGTNGDPKAYIFVQDNFGQEVADGFAADKYILVIETIMNFQYSIVNPNGGAITRQEAEQMADDYLDSLGSERNFMLEARDRGLEATYKLWLDNRKAGNYNDAAKIYNTTRKGLRATLINSYLKTTPTGKYTLVGNPVTGTVPELVKYKEKIVHSDTALDSYTNKAALFAERIEAGGAGERAGFKAWTGSTSTQLSNADVLNHGVAMMVVTANMDNGIHTWDQNLGPIPGPAPADPTNPLPPQLSIVKNYRTHDATNNTYADDGCFIRKDVPNKIIIDDEPEYKVIGWKVSTTTNDNIDSINWNPPAAISKTGTSSGSTILEGAEHCLYVLLEREEAAPPVVKDYNYKITQSSITRKIHLSNPDNWLSMSRIQNHTFVWTLGAHQTSCSGHTWYCGGCEDNSCNCNLKEGESCSKDHGKHCDGHTEYCSNFDWYDKTLKLSVTNTQKNNYPDILATKSGWNFETEQSKLTKHWYKDNTTFNRESTGAVVYTDTNWDYVCVIHRGKDKLTLAQWINSSLVNSDLRDVSGSGYAVANTLQGTRKLVDYYDKFNNFNRLKRII